MGGTGEGRMQDGRTKESAAWCASSLHASESRFLRHGSSFLWQCCAGTPTFSVCGGVLVHRVHTSQWLEFTYHSWCQVTNVLTTRLQVSSLFKERLSSASMIKSPVTLHEVSSWEYRCQQAESSLRPPEGDAEVCERPSMIRILLCLCTFSQKGQIRQKHCQEACVEHSESMALRHGIMFCFHIACTVCLWLSSSAWFLATLHTYVACNISWCFGGFDRNCVRSEVVAFLFGFFQRQFVEFLQREEGPALF